MKKKDIIPRELIFMDRKDIREFGIYDKASLNQLIYQWLLERPELEQDKFGIRDRKLAAFNDAYYICTIILMVPQSEDWISYYKDRINQPSVVLPMVYCYLIKLKSESLIYLIKAIETSASTDKILIKNLDDIKKVIEKWEEPVPTSLFNRRKLTPEELSTIEWRIITEGFKANIIKRIITNVAYNEDEQKMIAEAIKNAAQMAEDKFYNPDPEPYIDEDNYDNNDSLDDSSFWTPDYSDAYKLCDKLLSGEVYIGRTNNNSNRDGNDSIDTYSESLSKLKDRIKELEAENEELKDTVDSLKTNISDISVESKVGLTLLKKLMENDGANFGIHGNKVVARKVMMMITNRSDSACKAIYAYPLISTAHKKKIEELNSLLEKLKMNIRL